MSYEKTMITGNVGNAAVVRQTQSGMQAIGFSVATNKKWVDDDGVEHEATKWFNCTKWVPQGKSVEVAKYLLPGTIVTVDGEINASHYKTDEGKIMVSLELKIVTLKLISKPATKEKK